MTKAQAKELSEILKAYSEGKIIQRREFTYNEFEDVPLPLLYAEIGNYEYRIKPQPRLVPFIFEDRDLFKDRWFKFKNCSTLCKITGMNKDEVYFGEHIFSYESLLKYFTFEDNSPCGKYIG